MSNSRASRFSARYNAYVTDFVTQHAANPFFLYMPFSHVHTTAGNQPESQYAGYEESTSTPRSDPMGPQWTPMDPQWTLISTLSPIPILVPGILNLNRPSRFGLLHKLEQKKFQLIFT